MVDQGSFDDKSGGPLSRPAAVGPATSNALGDAVEASRAEGLVPTLFIPLGSTEQHGPHLPLETDTIIATAWAVATARVVPGSVVAPALAYGSSGEHQGFPGTISVGQEALEVILIEIVRSAANDYDRFVFVSGHAGNAQPLAQVVAKLRYEKHNVRSAIPGWPTDQTTGPVDAHAGRTETSLLLHLRPDLVGDYKSVNGNSAPLAELMPQLVAGGVKSVASSGVLGQPSGATAEEGRRLFDSLVKRLAERL